MVVNFKYQEDLPEFGTKDLLKAEQQTLHMKVPWRNLTSTLTWYYDTNSVLNSKVMGDVFRPSQQTKYDLTTNTSLQIHDQVKAYN